MTSTHSIHIVRRYGPVGGMENYVFLLTRALAALGQQVTVICERNEDPASIPVGESPPINIIVVGNAFRKPRWLAQWGFSSRVADYLQLHKNSEAVVHSHERTRDHQVTTFHGPPFLNRKKRLLDFLSPRIHMWSYLERRELLGDQVLAILPNSPMIADQLTRLYPAAASKVRAPAYPGVAAEYAAMERQQDGRLVVGFSGREWRRKGLDIACQVVTALRESMPDIHFLVAGCDPDEVRHLFKDWPPGSYTLAGWLETPADFFGKIDLLLHPARSEPFGMVVAEANAAHIPVIVSENCGVASLITEAQGEVCSLNHQQPDLSDWVAACRTWLNQDKTVSPLTLTWENLAEQHIALYQALQPLRSKTA